MKYDFKWLSVYLDTAEKRNSELKDNQVGLAPTEDRTKRAQTQKQKERQQLM